MISKRKHGGHTPGPWVAIATQETRISRTRVTESIGIHARGCVVCDVIPQPDGIAWANADLIVAVPDLLAACQAALTYHATPGHGNEIHPDQWTMIRAAVTKAKVL